MVNFVPNKGLLQYIPTVLVDMMMICENMISFILKDLQGRLNIKMSSYYYIENLYYLFIMGITWAQFWLASTCPYDDMCSIYDICSFCGNAHVVNHKLLFTTSFYKMKLFPGTNELNDVEYGKGITLAVIMCFYFYPQFSGVGSTAVPIPQFLASAAIHDDL